MPSAANLILEAVELHRQGELDQAEGKYRQALEQEPNHPDALNLLGMILIDRGEPLAAAKLIARAVAISPRTAPYHLNLGNAFAAANLDDLAADALAIAASLEPSNVVARYNLGLLHVRHDRRLEALGVLRQVLEIDSSHSRARFLVTGLSGESDGNCDTVAAGYVADLFDSYAASFDEHVVGVLDYKVPETIKALLLDAGHQPERAWNVLDLGCGTGLCGVALHGFARRMIGSDLSGRMIETAAKREVYDELHVEDLVSTLRRERDVDLVVAADVFIYVGALEATFAACSGALYPGGLFAFSTERWDGNGGRLATTCRYAHSDSYIRELAQRDGFAIDMAQDTVIRTQDKEPIPGVAYLLRRSG